MSKALPSLYDQFHQENDSFNDNFRDDSSSFTFGDQSDIFIEEYDLYPLKPWEIEFKEFRNIAKNSLQEYINLLDDYYKYVKNDIIQIKGEKIDSHPENPRWQNFFEKFRGATEIQNFIELEKIEIRNGDEIDSFIEYDFLNQQEIKIIDDQSHLVNSLLNSEKYFLGNYQTVLSNIGENDKSGYADNFRLRSLGEILKMYKNPNLKSLKKKSLPIVFPHHANRREVGDQCYLDWTGLQIFDIDIKTHPEYQDNPEKVKYIKELFFQELKKYPWFLSVNTSHSGKSFHIWTKGSKLHNRYYHKKDNIKLKKFWYYFNYYHKFTIIAELFQNKLDIDISKWDKIIDTHASKPNQGIAITYDPDILINPNFHLYPIPLHHTESNQDKYYQMFIPWFNQIQTWKDENLDIDYQENQSYRIGKKITPKSVGKFDIENIPSGSRYSLRWRTANTICYFWGDTQLSRDLIHHVLETEKTNTVQEINSYINSAIIYKRKPCKYTIKKLNSIGFGIKTEISKEEKEDNIRGQKNSFFKNIEMIKYPFENHQINKRILLGKDEYLNDYQQELIQSFKTDKINLIESAPNTGKTTLFKELAKKKKVCLVIPFTSTIDSKIVNDPEIIEYFKVYYGYTSISEIDGKSSVVMTFDKFSRLPTSKYKYFDYIVIDESHLLFTSSYRLIVTSNIINKVKTYLKNDASKYSNTFGRLFQDEEINLSKIVFMSGTVTGETKYLKYYQILNYIKIDKQHPFKKDVIFTYCLDETNRKLTVYHQIISALKSGKRIIHPTNSGDKYVYKTIKVLEGYLNREIKYRYYKRSNSNQDFLKTINLDSTIGDIEILFCTDYLSVGIDINDIKNFEVIYHQSFTGEEIEQFNNRIRNSDIKTYVPFNIFDQEGYILPSIFNIEKIEYTRDKETENFVLDDKNISEIQQKVNQVNSIYHGMVSQFRTKYYIDEYGRPTNKFLISAFEIDQFEKKYRKIAKGLIYIKTCLQDKYGYKIEQRISKNYSDEDIEFVKEIESVAEWEFKKNKSDSFKEAVYYLSIPEIFSIIKSHQVILEKLPDNSEKELFVGDVKDNTVKLYYQRKYNGIIENALSVSYKLSKIYSIETVYHLLENEMSEENQLISYGKLNRYINLLNVIYYDSQSLLSKNVKKTIKIIYQYLDESDFAILDIYRYSDLVSDVKKVLKDEIKFYTGIEEFKSEKRNDEVGDYVQDFIKLIVEVNKSKKNGEYFFAIKLNKIYPFDGDYYRKMHKTQKEFQRLIYGIENLPDEIIKNNLETTSRQIQNINSNGFASKNRENLERILSRYTDNFNPALLKIEF